MAEIGVLVKVPEELHSQLKRASARHQRSMQKVVLALLEGWIAHGAPDPLNYGNPEATGNQHGFEDAGAREALIQVAAELKELKQRISAIETGHAQAKETKLNFPSFYEALREAANDTTAGTTQA